jgi:hypothetical protein
LPFPRHHQQQEHRQRAEQDPAPRLRRNVTLRYRLRDAGPVGGGEPDETGTLEALDGDAAVAGDRHLADLRTGNR